MKYFFSFSLSVSSPQVPEGRWGATGHASLQRHLSKEHTQCLSGICPAYNSYYTRLAYVTQIKTEQKFFHSYCPWHFKHLSSNLFLSLNFILLFSAHFQNLWDSAEFLPVFSLVLVLPHNLIFSVNLISMLFIQNVSLIARAHSESQWFRLSTSILISA